MNERKRSALPPTDEDVPPLNEDIPAQHRATIRCIPTSICSWNFLLDGAGHHAILEFGLTSEQGTIVVDRIRFDVDKQGMLSGRWTLNHQGNEVAAAQKPSALARTFEIQEPGGDLVLRAKSPFARSFRLERSDDIVATIAPDHPLTRRATIEIVSRQTWDMPTVCFSFWLVAMMWRREASNNSG